MILGIDEAGRGALIGPLVIAGVCIEESNVNTLKNIGVKDSKELSKNKRVLIAREIEKISDVVVLKIGPCKIDTYRKTGIDMNKIEAIKMATIINYFDAHKIYIDCPSNNINSFNYIIKRMLDKNIDIVAEHSADKKYLVVSAASIIAKVERDKEIEKIRKKYGDLGSGYPSDEKTIEWVKNYWIKYGKLPKGIVRESWETLKNLGIRKEKNILNFFKRFSDKSK